MIELHENDVANFETIKGIVQQGDVLIDVGAHVGLYTRLFCDLLKGTGRVYSIEMNPDLMDNLYAEFRDDRNVSIMQYAISNTNLDGWYYKAHNSYTATITGKDLNGNRLKKTAKVATRRLDKILLHEPKIKLIKIDVEAAELLALEGLWDIADRVEYMLIECHLEKDWPKIAALLEHYKFDAWSITDNAVANVDTNRAYQCFCTKRHEPT